MYIKKLQLINFKNIKEFRADLTKGIYLVTAENDRGKSNLISAIVTCLTGNRSDNLLTKGEEAGSIQIEIGEEKTEYTLELRYTEKNPRGTIYITDQNGMSSSNLSALQQLFQYTDFDAHQFVMMSNTAEGRRKQMEIVKGLIPQEIRMKIDQIERELPVLEQNRTEWGRKIKDLDGAVKEMGIGPEDIEYYTAPIDIKDLNKRIDEGYQRNNEIARKEEELQAHQSSLDVWDEKMDTDLAKFDDDGLELEAQIQALKEKQEQLLEQRKLYIKKMEEDKAAKEQSVKALKTYLGANKKTSIESLREQADKAGEHNIRFEKVQEYKTKQERLSAAAKERQKVDDEIKEKRAEKEELIKSAKLPIKGLTFEEEGLAIDGIPFRPGEVSTSQEIEIAARLIMAMNPKTKIFKLMNGESIGQEKFKAIVEFAKKNGYQGFIEEMHRGQNDLVVEEYSE